MRRYLLFFLLSLVFINTNAQNEIGKADDLERIALTVYIPDNVPTNARKSLENKLNQIVTRNGLAGTDNQRFIITAKIDVLTKNITATAPVMQAFTLNVNFYVGDGIDGTLFSSCSTTVKGVGETEDKAYLAALKNIKANEVGLKSMIETGKEKIIAFYNSHCDFILKEAQTKIDGRQYDEAIEQLLGIPNVCKDCYDKAMDLLVVAYQAKIDNECEELITQAQSAWAERDGKKSTEFLSQIPAGSKCKDEAAALMKEIAKYVDEKERLEYEQKMREFDEMSKQNARQHEERMATINAAKEIGKAYAKRQPIVYHVFW